MRFMRKKQAGIPHFRFFLDIWETYSEVLRANALYVEKARRDSAFPDFLFRIFGEDIRKSYVQMRFMRKKQAGIPHFLCFS